MLRAADKYDIKVCMYITILKSEQLLSALTGLNQFAPVVKVANYSALGGKTSLHLVSRLTDFPL